MAGILPFKGIFYNSDKVNLSEVIAPPYDVISDDEREKYCKNKHNVVNLALPKSYKTAAFLLNEWLTNGVLARDKEDSFYIYEQTFKLKNEVKKRIGIFSLVRLEDYLKRIILPHEDTLSKPKEDRLKLIESCKANLEPIMSIYPNSKILNEILEKEMKINPLFEITHGGEIHRLWRVSDRRKIKVIQNELRNKKIFIADGHHRYETSLNYCKEGGYPYIMMVLISDEDPGLVILPAHRIIKDIDLDKSKFDELGKYFHVKEIIGRENFLRGIKNNNFVIYNGNYYLLELKNREIINTLNNDRSREWKFLDVTVLHSLILDKIFGINDVEKHVIYEKDEQRVIDMVNNNYKFAIFLNPTKIEQVKKIALNNEKMPGKATYFYPKLISGLVINRFDTLRNSDCANSPL